MKAIAYTLQLEAAAIEGDKVAISAYEQIDKILARTSKAIKRNEEIMARLHQPKLKNN